MHDFNCAQTEIDERALRIGRFWTVLLLCDLQDATVEMGRKGKARVGRLNGSAIWLVFRLPPVTLHHTCVQPLSASTSLSETCHAPDSPLCRSQLPESCPNMAHLSIISSPAGICAVQTREDNTRNRDRTSLWRDTTALKTVLTQVQIAL